MGFRLVIGTASLCVSLWTGPPVFAQSQVAIHPTKGYLVLNDTTYRLDGATLPHPDALCQSDSGNWRCGEAAWQALSGRVARGAIECVALVSLSASASTANGLPAECALDGESLNTWLVRYGWALTDDSPAAPFQEEETLAQQEAIGIWRDGFVPPDNWRASGTSDCDVCSARHESIVRARERLQQNAGGTNTD